MTVMTLPVMRIINAMMLMMLYRHGGVAGRLSA
jgi:hypothetical protein